ncbi:MAG: hypothetical protein ACTHU0_01190 [Kofleriaceae bacterium]
MRRLLLSIALMWISLGAARAAPALRAADARFSGVWANDAGQVIAVGRDGRVATSGDAGATWITDRAPTGAWLTAVWSDGRGLVIAVGEHGAIARRDGATWTTPASGTGHPLTAVWGDGAWIVAVGGGYDQGSERGVIAWSSDRGATWSTRIVPETIFRAVYGRDADHVVAVGSDGTIYGTQRRGAWEPRVSPIVERTPGGRSVSNPVVMADLSVVTADAAGWIALGSGGELVTSPDGVRWTPQDRPFYTAARGVVHHRGARVVFGPVERAVQTPRGWRVQDLRSHGMLDGIAITPGGTIYAVGHTGGRVPNPAHFTSMGCRDAACPDTVDLPWRGVVQRSRDAGATWTLLTR